ncbi:hypothetical protein D3C78_1975020 [compost metagenome]
MAHGPADIGIGKLHCGEPHRYRHAGLTPMLAVVIGQQDQAALTDRHQALAGQSQGSENSALRVGNLGRRAL